MRSRLPDAAARHTALTALDRSLLVEAGAGTGKTSLLAGRVAMLLISGVAPERIAAITFTEAAAAELAHRIDRLVDELLRGAVPMVLRDVLPRGLGAAQRVRLQRASAAFDDMICTTIHGLCRRLLVPYPVETGLDPDATVMDTATAEREFREHFEAWLRAQLADDDPFADAHASSDPPPRPTARLVRALASRAPDETVDLVRRVARGLQEHRDARAVHPEEEVSESARLLSETIRAFTDWYRGCGLVEPRTATLVDELAHLDACVRTVTDAPHCASALAVALRHPPPGACRRGERRFRRWQETAGWRTASIATGCGEAHGQALGASAWRHYEDCGEAYSAWCAALAAAATQRLVGELEAFRRAHGQRLRSAGLLEFDALVRCTRDLLRDHEPVRSALARRHTHLLVDEFQDTDPVQSEILWRLAGEGDSHAPWHARVIRPGALFLVGDPKQAIYRFRGAEIDTYRTAKQALQRSAPDCVLEIVTNFRTRSAILGFVNHTFASRLTEPAGQPGFTALQPTRGTGGTPCVIAFDVVPDTRGTKKRRVSGVDALRRAEAVAVADTVARLIGDHPVWDPSRNTRRPACAGDIALLAPTGTGLWIYERAFDERGIAVHSHAGRGLFARQEVHDLVAIARTLADARDTAALGALLRGPLVGLTEEDIADAIEPLGGSTGQASLLTLWTPPTSSRIRCFARRLPSCRNSHTRCTARHHTSC